MRVLESFMRKNIFRYFRVTFKRQTLILTVTRLWKLLHSRRKMQNNDWFSETGVLNADEVRVQLKVNEKLDERKSQFQSLMAFKNEMFGRCLVLNNAIQCTELDECSYQEMMTFLPLNVHPCPKRVLIIGGGDGGVAREVDKHPMVEEIVQCEIDEEVIKISKEHLPFMAKGFDSKKLKLHFADGYKYVLEHPNSFDVIITDSSDPIGPAVTLFEKEYYRALYDCLRPGGIICCQAESYWFHLKFIRELLDKVRPIFPTVAYASIAVASYPSGQIGFLLASKDRNTDFKSPRTVFSEEDIEKYELKYYSPDMHRASFVLPRFVTKQLNKI